MSETNNSNLLAAPPSGGPADLLAITERRERAVVLCELHKRWKKTMTVSVWGRGMATRVDGSNCLLPGARNGAEYPGDCQGCDFFMGAKTRSGMAWGAHAKACCALDLVASETPQPSLARGPDGTRASDPKGTAE